MLFRNKSDIGTIDRLQIHYTFIKMYTKPLKLRQDQMPTFLIEIPLNPSGSGAWSKGITTTTNYSSKNDPSKIGKSIG